MGALGASQLAAFPEVKFYLTLKGIEGVFTRSVRARNQFYQPRWLRRT